MLLSSLPHQRGQRRRKFTNAHRETKISNIPISSPALTGTPINTPTPDAAEEPKTAPMLPPTIVTPPKPSVDPPAITDEEGQFPRITKVTYSEGCNAIIDLPLWRERHCKRIMAAAAVAAKSPLSENSRCNNANPAPDTPASLMPQQPLPAEIAANKLKYLIAHPNKIRGFEVPSRVSRVTLLDGTVLFRAPDGQLLKQLSHVRDYMDLGEEEMGEEFIGRWFD